MSPPATLPLFPLFPLPQSTDTREVRSISARTWFEIEDDLCVVWVHGAPWHRFAWSNSLDRRVVGASMCLAGIAQAIEVARAFELNRDTLYRDRKRLSEGGLPAIARLRPGPNGPSKATPELERRAKRLFAAGHSKRAIARRLGVSDGTVRGMLKGVTVPDAEESATQREFVVEPIVSATPDARDSEEDSAFLPALPHPAETTERDLDRSMERVLARFGMITEADVRFVSGEKLRFVGALLILPALVASGFFKGVESVYGGLKNGFYGLRHTVMTLALMLTLRVKRAEHLTGIPPAALGRLLGLDRAPEVKTLRRRLHEMATLGKANQLLRWFAEHLAHEEPEVVGFLYIDGHVREYTGKRTISKAYSTRRRLALAATTDYWVNDANADPLFVVTGSVSSQLTKYLLPIIEDVCDLLPEGQRPTFIFDRGGWSPKLFRKIIDTGCDFITYRKGNCPTYRVADFTEHRLIVNGREVSYQLRDGWARPGAKLQLRCIVRRDEGGNQIPLLTNNTDLPAAEVVYRLSDRWRQENFFKYARDEYALDSLDTYRVEAETSERLVSNPARRKIDRAIKDLKTEAGQLEAELGRALDANKEGDRPTVRGFKIAHADVRRQLAEVGERIDKLVRRRRKLPTKIPATEAVAPGKEAVRLETEHKHLTNVIKMAVYRAESALFRILGPHHCRNEDEGRALLREAFRSSGSLEVVDGELRVLLDPLSAPRRSRAIAALCADLNTTRTRIPGTSLRLRFGVRGHGDV
jgi:hypothetical protein